MEQEMMSPAGSVVVVAAPSHHPAISRGTSPSTTKGSLSLKVTQTDNEAETELRVEGVLDALTASDMRSVVDAVVTSNRLRVKLDLARLRLIDSSGVGALVSLYKRVRAKGGSVVVVGLRDQPLTVFRLLRLDHVFSA
jgi:anti-sigma B factor antagonist